MGEIAERPKPRSPLLLQVTKQKRNSFRPHSQDRMITRVHHYLRRRRKMLRLALPFIGLLTESFLELAALNYNGQHLRIKADKTFPHIPVNEIQLPLNVVFGIF